MSGQYGEPWRVDGGRDVVDAAGEAVLLRYRQRVEAPPRAVACVNALAGIPTAAIEAGVVGEMREMLVEAREHFESAKADGCLRCSGLWERIGAVLARLEPRP